MSEQTEQAKRWLDEADATLQDLPEPVCRDADKLATAVSALQIAGERLLAAIENLERDRA